MSEKKRKIFSSQAKAKVALEAIRGVKTVNEIAQAFGVHPTQVGLWKKALQDQAESVFAHQRGPKPIDEAASAVLLLPKITAGYVDYLVNFRSVQPLKMINLQSAPTLRLLQQK